MFCGKNTVEPRYKYVGLSFIKIANLEIVIFQVSAIIFLKF